jgi:outer membrane protein assembly factor BamD
MKNIKIVITYCFLLFLLSFSSCATNSALKKETVKSPVDLISDGISFSEKGDYERAIERFKDVLRDHPLSEQVLDAQILLADTYYEMKEYEDAASYYTEFVTLHPTHIKAPYAQFRKGMCYFKDVLTIDRDQSTTKKAILAFDDLSSNYPLSISADKAKTMADFLRHRLAVREFYVGNFYFKSGNYKGALARFEHILNKYPNSNIIDKSLFYAGESYFALGEDDLAKEAFARLINDFPESPFTDQAKLRLAEDNSG